MSDDVRDREFLGKGLAFPLQFNPRGEIALANGERDIEQSIHLILSTIPGERVMRPNFGCRAWELVFAPINSETSSLMSYYVTEALSFWEPRVEVMKVEVFRDTSRDSGLLVEVYYSIKATHDQRSIVYPFFIVDEEPAV
jgi:phage baseplate assembly protein W